MSASVESDQSLAALHLVFAAIASTVSEIWVNDKVT